MNKTKKIAVFIGSLALAFIAALPVLATSTVMLDPPDVADLIGTVYTIAQPIFVSLWPLLKFVIGFMFVFGAIKLVVNAVGERLG
jgi:hypothetical protein